VVHYVCVNKAVMVCHASITVTFVVEEIPHIIEEELSHNNVYSVYMWYGGRATHN
jgi:hypothetical protein